MLKIVLLFGKIFHMMNEGEYLSREGERPREPLSADVSHLPTRRHPSKNSFYSQGFRSIILFVTVCVAERRAVLNSPDIIESILSAWRQADEWVVGRYVIMPDHIHFFCMPTTYPPYDFHKWMRYWKRLVTQSIGDASKLWQTGCWDTQMRTLRQYEEKWEYVRNNPVRKGLVDGVEDWPYQGFVNDLKWHD